MFRRIVLSYLILVNVVFASVVSNLNGEYGVDKGVFNYEVKLALPEGVAGVQPKVSLVYTSSQVNGYLGVGWNISGLSSITRCGYSKIIDGYNRGISYNSKDNICLDGKRLILTSGEKWEEGSEYHPYMQDYSKVVYDNDKFIVYTKSGDIKKYKKILSSWQLVEIQDRFDNKITYKYHISDTESYISQISFGHKRSIDFVYENRKDKVSIYQHGKQYKMTKRLSKVLLMADGKELRRYELKYDNESYASHRSMLVSIMEKSQDKSLIPLKIKYPKQTKMKFDEINHKFKVTDRPMWMIDFNNDGFVDRVINYKHHVYFEKGKGDGSFKLVKSISQDDPLSQVQFGDFNKDGYIDMFAMHKGSAKIYQNQKGKDFKVKKYSQLPVVTVESVMSDDYYTSYRHLYKVVDFDLDGDSDILEIVYPGENDARMEVVISLFKFDKKMSLKKEKLKTLPFRYENNMGLGLVIEQLKYSHDIFIADLNGDGLPDLCIPRKNISLFNIKGKALSSKHSLKIPAIKRMSFETGDFNGDGVVDILQIGKNKMNVWLNNAKGVFKKAYSFDYGVKAKYIKVADFNGDGLSDIYRIHDGSDYVMFNKGGGKFDRTHHKINVKSSWYNVLFGDINGDGFIDVIEKGDDGDIFLNNFKSLLATSIEDSFANKIYISYTTLTDKSVYKAYSKNLKNSINITSSAQVVSRIEEPSFISSVRSKTRYFYEGLRVSTKGYGNLGFAKISTINNLSKTKTTIEYRQDSLLAGIPKRTQTYIDDSLVTQEDFKYQLNRDSKINTINLIKQVTKSYQDGDLLKTKVVENQDIDEYGNVCKIKETIIDETTSDRFVTITDNIYENYEDNWVLGRLVNAKVTKSAYGDTQTRESQFEYDIETGILTKETIEPDAYNGITKEYIYDELGRKVKEVVSSGDKKHTLRYSYRYNAKAHRVVTTTNELGWQSTQEYDSEGRAIYSKDVNGFVSTVKYDAFGKKIQESSMVGTPLELHRYYTYAFDSSYGAYYRIDIKEDGKAKTSTYYNKSSKEIFARGVGFDGKIINSYVVYDALGRVSKKSLPYFDGDTPVEFKRYYDVYGRLIKESNPSPDGGVAIDIIEYKGYEIVHTNAKKQTKRVLKNALEKDIRIEEEEGASIEYEYDAMGNLILTRDAKGNEIQISYDKFGQKIKQIDPDMGEWSYRYDGFGKLIYQRDAKGNITKIAYDNLGRKVQESINGTDVSKWYYDGAFKGSLDKESSKNSTTTYSYDSYTRVVKKVKEIDDVKTTTQFVYDRYGKVTQKSIDEFVLKYDYNTDGYLLAIKSPKEQIQDFDEEHFKKLLEKLLIDSTNYYEKQLQAETKAKELRVKAQEYIALANKYKKYQKELYSTAKRLQKISKRYKAASLRYKSRAKYYKKRAKRYLYIANKYKHRGYFGRWISKIFKRYAKRYAKIALYYTKRQKYLESKAKRYEQYANEKKEQVQDAKDEEESYLRLAKEALQEAKKAQQIASHYKEKAQAVEKDKAVADAYTKILADDEYQYFYKILEVDASGHISRYISGNGLITQDIYDEVGALNRTTTGYAQQTALKDSIYSYDKLGNTIQRDDEILGVHKEYEYDNLNRLIYATTRFKDGHIDRLHYDYDELGNLLFKTSEGAYNYNLSAPHQVSSTDKRSFVYDANGNMVKNGNTDISYTPFNKVKTIDTPTNSIEFGYGTNHEKVYKIDKRGTTLYYDKEYEAVFDKNNEMVSEKYFIYANDKVIATYETTYEGDLAIGKSSYYHYDALNSVDMITNNIGEVEQRLSYKPFGERESIDSNGYTISQTPKTQRGFTGHEHIEDTPFIDMNARLYDPTLGKFLSADTIIPSVSDTQSYNRYSYVKNNPLKYTDPTGHSWLSKLWKKVKKYIKTIITIAVVAVATIFSPFSSIIATGAFAGFTGGVVGTLLHGGSIADAMNAGFKGALFGGLSAGLAYGVAEMTASVFHIGSDAAHSLSLFHTGGKVTATLFKAVAHGISRVFVAKLQGGKLSSSFWSGFASSAFSVGTKGYGGITGRTMIMAVVGGTVSELTGGKFANGAVSGAFVHLFNAEGGTLSKIWKGLTGGISKVYDRKDEILSDAKTGLNAHVKDIPKALKGGLNGYRQVRDNAPAVPRYMLKGAMTAVELGLTKWIKDPVLYIYVNVNTGVYMDTIPLNPVSFSANRIHNYSSHDSSWFE